MYYHIRGVGWNVYLLFTGWTQYARVCADNGDCIAAFLGAPMQSSPIYRGGCRLIAFCLELHTAGYQPQPPVPHGYSALAQSQL